MWQELLTRRIAAPWYGIPLLIKFSWFSEMFTGLRPSLGLSDTILDSSTHALQEKLGSVRFRSPYQKCGGKEEYEFSGLSGQVSNF